MAPNIFSLEGQNLRFNSVADIQPHLDALAANNEVTEIRFFDNTIGVEAAAALAEVLKTKKTLQYAGLDSVFGTRTVDEIPKAIDSLLQALLTLPNLHTVNINDNAFGLSTIKPILPFLASHTPLVHLYLNNNGMGPIAGTEIGKALAKLAERKKESGAPALESIVCGRNRLEAGGMEGWEQAFRANTSIKSVRMTQNGIRIGGIMQLINGLKHVKGLEVLDLEDNTFTTKGSKALANALPTWPELKELSLNDCFLGTRGFAAITEALGAGQNNKLEVFKFAYARADENGIKLLADILELSLPALRKIELTGNNFDEDNISVTKIREILDERREAAGVEEGDENWGIEEEIDQESFDESDEDDGTVEEEEVDDSELRRADAAEAAPVAADKDKKVDELADLLGKAEI
ncbi:RNI-like protein [Microthyrium microscopicum]|uniref:RNI-like protein n=1 Tax=Microthyrium microscopicum TaxID=703497 RepID=A0A6A6UTI3_9PEZI|nr:RNI-like protein [Microthyrium microscopicum]